MLNKYTLFWLLVSISSFKNLVSLEGNTGTNSIEMIELNYQSLVYKIQSIANKPVNLKGYKVIFFYKTGITSFLGNFAECPNFCLWGLNFHCAEAAYQWKKYNLIAEINQNMNLLNDPLMTEFFSCNGEQAYKIHQRLNKKYSHLFHSEWKKGLRDQVMWEIVNAKFEQNPIFKILLEATGTAYLLEHNERTRDDYWSDNSNGKGKNMLGKMLMAIRDNKPIPRHDDNKDADLIREYCKYANFMHFDIF